MKWEAFKEEVETLRDHAITYENSYNMIKGTIERQDNVKAVFQALPQAVVVKERERLQEAKRIAISEKGAYVLVLVSYSKGVGFQNSLIQIKTLLVKPSKLPNMERS